MPLVPQDRGDAHIDVAPTAEQVSLGVGKLELHPHAEAREVACLDFVGPAQNAVQHVQPLHQQHRKHYPKDICNYEANPRYCTFANSWSTPCREHSTCLYLCTVLLLRLVHET